MVLEVLLRFSLAFIGILALSYPYIKPPSVHRFPSRTKRVSSTLEVSAAISLEVNGGCLASISSSSSSSAKSFHDHHLYCPFCLVVAKTF